MVRYYGNEFHLATVPYRFPLEFFHARGHFAQGLPYFFPKILRFPAKKVKSANRSATIFKQIILKKSVSANRTEVNMRAFFIKP